MKLPAYEANGSIGVSSAPLQRPDTSIARAAMTFGATLGDAGESVAKVELAKRKKLQEDAERNENLRLEYDLLAAQNTWRDKLEEAKTNSPEDAAHFTDNFDTVMQDDVTALEKKWSTHHDPEYVKLKIAQARNPLSDQASVFEFQKSTEFKKTVLDDKVANLSASFTVAGGPAFADVATEYKQFVDTTISGDPKVREQGYKYGLRTIQKAWFAAKAGQDVKGVVDAYTKTMSAPADSAVLPPHVASFVTNANANGFDPQTLLAIGWIESNLNPKAGRPTRKDGTVMSSAEGILQITEATRDDLGLTAKDLYDVDKVTAAASDYLTRKQEWMRSNRIDPTPGRTYMMWNMGHGLAAAVMRANPNERIETVIARVHAKRGPAYVNEVINNNPKMYKAGQTVGQVLANYENVVADAAKTTGKMYDGAGLNAEDRTKTFLTQLGLPGDQFITAGDVAEIAEKAIADYGKQTKDNADILRGQSFLNGTTTIDPYSSDDKRAVEKALADHMPAITDGVTKGDGEALSTVRSLAREVRHVPEPVRNAMRLTLETGEPTAKARVFDTLLDLRKADRSAFNATGFDEDTRKRIEEYEAYTTEMLLPSDVAISRIDKERSEDGKLRTKVMSSEVNKELGKVSDRKLVAFLSGDPLKAPAVGSQDIDSNRLLPVIRSHFTEIYRNAREEGKSKAEAEAVATSSMKRSFGISTATRSTGEPVVMMFPPEAYYPAMWDEESKWTRWGMPDGHAWITKQARSELAVHLLTSGKVKTEKIDATGRMPAKTVHAWEAAEQVANSTEVRLIATAQTKEDIRLGRLPSYQLWFRNSQGQVEMLNESFTPDSQQARQSHLAQFSERNKQAGNHPPMRVRKWITP